MKKVASKNLKKPKVAENSKICQNSKTLPKISKVAEKLPTVYPLLYRQVLHKLIYMNRTLCPYMVSNQKSPTTSDISFVLPLLRSTKWNASLILLRDYAELVSLCKVMSGKPTFL